MRRRAVAAPPSRRLPVVLLRRFRSLHLAPAQEQTFCPAGTLRPSTSPAAFDRARWPFDLEAAVLRVRVNMTSEACGDSESTLVLVSWCHCRVNARRLPGSSVRGTAGPRHGCGAVRCRSPLRTRHRQKLPGSRAPLGPLPRPYQMQAGPCGARPAEAAGGRAAGGCPGASFSCLTDSSCLP
jgi:hypothetical protein